ncbi:PREDICTED: rho GTPase-activating protein 20-like isoform X2 [Priapulus caudatus]|uniref:Rho GTPase-activating protein 20-like isoform X2 n=1 Tax=Priapulus caudatus TaxID=37621 RepID=A0ABM1DPE5_PRICU|nr:PREDICTED: rho GTPase-activating protein 20-like isoform X2 [Priapulus caudatus]
MTLTTKLSRRKRRYTISYVLPDCAVRPSSPVVGSDSPGVGSSHAPGVGSIGIGFSWRRRHTMQSAVVPAAVSRPERFLQSFSSPELSRVDHRGTVQQVERLWNYEKYIQELLLETQSVHPDFDELNRASARTSTMMKQLSEPQDVVHADVQNEYRLEKVQNLFPNDNLGLLGIYPQKAKTLQRRKTFAGKGYKNNFTLSLSPQMDIETRSVRSSLNNNTGRFYVMEGPVTLTSGVQVQDRHLFVFSDLLLIAKPNKSSTSYKLKHRVRVCELWFSDCLSIVCEATKHQETSFVIGWPTTNVVATFASPQLKNNWLAKLKELIAMGKEKEVPKTVVLKIYVSNSNNGAHYKSVTISNTETAAECVQKACNLFEINAVDAGNYQLWVTSGKEETYPLIGHEHPYSILMSLIRDSRHGDDLSSPLDLGQICVPDNQTHCQFRLVQRQKPTITDSPKKSKKRSPANLKSLFKRSGKLQESPSSDSSPAGTPTGKLFRHPLSDVCDAEGSLPKPIMELLRELFAQGPRTQGIFRRSANKRVCNELKQKLDTGEAVCMADISVLTSATVLKDFCRSMPYCLLMSNLYHEWAAAVEETDTAQKCANSKPWLESYQRLTSSYSDTSSASCGTSTAAAPTTR